MGAAGMKTYTGIRTEQGALVLVDGHPLAPRLDLANKSPTGFEWGYGGSGPGQLALAILADHLQDDREALRLYQEFKWRVVAGWEGRTWRLTGKDVEEIVDRLRSDGALVYPA